VQLSEQSSGLQLCRAADGASHRSQRLAEHSGHWADHRHGDCHDGSRPRCVSARAESSRLGWAWCRGRIRPAGKPDWAASPNAVTVIWRRLLINGASANLLRSKATKADPWVIGIRRRRPPLVVAVALANKTARIAWAVMLRQKEYQPRALAA